MFHSKTEGKSLAWTISSLAHAQHRRVGHPQKNRAQENVAKLERMFDPPATSVQLGFVIEDGGGEGAEGDAWGWAEKCEGGGDESPSAGGGGAGEESGAGEERE